MDTGFFSFSNFKKKSHHVCEEKSVKMSLTSCRNSTEVFQNKGIKLNHE
jgi:hypothetical protein